MDTVVLGWDLERGTRWVPPYEHALAAMASSPTMTIPWGIAGGPVPGPGTQVHLMLQGSVRGLVGRGIVRSASFPAADAARPGTLAQHVLIAWDHLLPIDERIGVAELAARVPEIAWAELYSAVHPLSAIDAERLDRVWASPHPSAGARRPRARRPAGTGSGQALSRG
jgi:hypothetical protein